MADESDAFSGKVPQAKAGELSTTKGQPLAAWWNFSSPYVPLLMILALAFIVYIPTLGSWFAFDDFWFLRSADQIPFWEYAHRSLDFRETGSLPEFDRYRPLYPIIWSAMYRVFGLEAFGYRIVLLGLHLANIVLVWLIAERITRKQWAANLAALIFALHPAYATSLAWIGGGNRVFVTFPYLVSFFLFTRYVDGQGRRHLYYAVSFLAFVIAILIHSTALILAATLPAYVFLVARKPAHALSIRSWVPFVPFFAIAAALVGIQWWVRSHLGIAENFTFGWHQYSRYGTFLGLSLFPVLPGTLDVPSRVNTILEGAQGLASVVMIVLAVVLATRSRWPYAGTFVVFWFIASLLMDSTLNFPANGRLLYMPGIGIALTLVVGIVWLSEVLHPSIVRQVTKAAPVLVLVILAPMFLLTMQNARSPIDAGNVNERFVEQLREAIPSMDAGATLYVVDAPGNLRLFGSTSRMEALVALYYDDVDVLAISRNEIPSVEANLREGDEIFRFVR